MLHRRVAADLIETVVLEFEVAVLDDGPEGTVQFSSCQKGVMFFGRRLKSTESFDGFLKDLANLEREMNYRTEYREYCRTLRKKRKNLDWIMISESV